MPASTWSPRPRALARFHAIQCKLYAEDYRLQKGDIDSFFTASGKKPFSHRVIVSTTNHWSEHAEDALRDQQPPVSKIDLHDLENSQIDWSQYQPKAAPVLKAKKPLRPHQQAALDATLNGFQSADRGKLIMACGTGKTFTSLKIAEALAGKGKRVLFLVPSLSLLSQTPDRMDAGKRTSRCTASPSAPTATSARSARRKTTAFKPSPMSCAIQPPPNRQGWPLKWPSATTTRT